MQVMYIKHCQWRATANNCLPVNAGLHMHSCPSNRTAQAAAPKALFRNARTVTVLRYTDVIFLNHTDEQTRPRNTGIQLSIRGGFWWPKR
jgi:hypothetical protein